MRRGTISNRLLSLLLALTLSLSLAFPALAADDSAVGSTVQLAKTEGTVGVTNANGRKATILKNMKLYNGYHVSTEAKSYSWINLDSTKLIKEDASSQVEIRESGKKLEVLLNSGNLFFNVTKDLEEEETLNIRTSTMVAGIRGTCGWVRVIDRWNTHVYILEGRVECRVADPVTGQIKSTILTGGEQANFVVYPQDREGDKCDILQERFTESDIPGFVLVELVQDRGLCKDIYDDSGLDVLGKYPSEQGAQRRLEEDQAEAAKRQKEISAQETQQEHNISKDPVWKDKPSGNSSGGGSSSGGTSTPTRPGGATTLTMPVTVPQIIDALARYDTVNIVPGPGASPAEHTLTIDQNLTVPAGQSVNVADGDTDTSVRPGQTLQVDGTVNLDGDFTNEGSLNVTSGNTFKVGGEFYNEAAGVINNTKNGRIVAEKGIVSAGKINNTDSAEITSGALYTILAGSDFDYSIDPVFVTAGITGGWITNTNPKGGFALVGHNSGVENLSGCISHLRSVTPNIVGDDEGILGIWKALRFGGYSIALQDGYYRYVEAPGSTLTQTTYNSTSGMFYSSLTPVREGYVFQGWNTAADGSGTAYAPGTWPVGDENPPTTVYAQWGEAYDATISGKVIDQNGNAIAGAKVSLGENSAVSGDDGTYSLKASSMPAGSYTLTAQAEAWDLPRSADPAPQTLTGSQTVIIKDRNPVTQDLALTVPSGKRAVVFTGTVTDINSTPVSNIVSIRPKDTTGLSNTYFYPTDSNGVYTTPLLLVSSGSAVTVSASHKTAGSARQDITVPANGGATIVADLHLPREAIPEYTVTFSGSVKDTGGNPVPKAKVGIGSFRDPTLVSYPDTPVKEDGTYSTEITLPKDSTRITVGVDFPEGYEYADGSGPVTITNFTDGQTFTTNFILKPTTADDTVTFTGTVTDKNGNPLQGVEVKTGNGSNTTTDENGEYTLTGSYQVGDTYTLKATHFDSGYFIERTGTVTNSETSITVDFNFDNVESTDPDSVKLTIKGQVYSGKDESGNPNPVPGATITVNRNNPDEAPVTAESGDNGKYSCSITVDKDETITVSVLIDGYERPDSREFTAGESESNTIIADFELTPASEPTDPVDPTPDPVDPTDPVVPTPAAALSRAGLSTGRLAGALAGASIRPVLRGALSAAVAASGSFADVSAGSWYAGAADYCRTAGLMTGTGEGLFDPEGLMTRAMVATVLHRLAGSPVPEGEENPFTDVPAGSWYTSSVLWAQESGVMSGYPDGRFDPDGTITREQLAAVLWRLAGSPEAGDSTFADSASIAPYAAQAAGWAGGAGVINGMPDGRFAPKGSATRAQTAQIMTSYARTQGLVATCSAMNIMCAPAGTVLMPDSSLLVTDTYNKVIWRVAGGVSTVYAGSSTVEDHCGQPLGGYNDAALEESYFKRPWAIVPFLDGWAVSDTDNHAVRLISGGITQTVNGQTKEKLTISDLGVVFDAPTGLACDGEGNLYVADTLQNAIRKITPTGEVTTFAKDLNGPMGLFWAEGSLYAAETGANRIVRITAGKVEVLAGSGQSGFADGPAALATFSAPQALAVGEDGAVYVADTANGAVRKLQNGQITTLLRRDVTDLDSFAPVSPTGLLIRGNLLYICDNFSRKLLVFPLK